MTTRVVHRSKEPFDVYIGRGRGCIWGNRFKEGRDGTREEVIEKYARWIKSQPNLLAKIGTLKGKTLGCWCASKSLTYNDKPWICHGQVLAFLADTADE